MITDAKRLNPRILKSTKTVLPKKRVDSDDIEDDSEEPDDADIPKITEEVEASRAELFANPLDKEDKIIFISLKFIYANFTSTVIFSKKNILVNNTFENVEIIVCASEEAMIGELIQVLCQTKPRLLIGYNTDELLFPF
ncbi:hypothetical protein GEMRC1_013893 [Eukaryota sp. GEM-RC1]